MFAGTAVAAADSVLFVNTSADSTDYKVYNLRNLGEIKNTDKAVAYVKDSSGRILYAYVDLGRVPGGATADTLYGMITTDLRTVKVGDEQYKQATVWTNDGDKTIKVDADYVGTDAGKLNLKKGTYISFKETSDELYDKTTGEMAVLAANVTEDISAEHVLDVAVDTYSESDKTLSYYVKDQLEKKADTGIFEAKDDENVKVNALDKDAVIVFVDRDNKKGLDDVGISAFPETKGYANAKLIFDETDKKIVAIIFNANNDTDVNGDKVALGDE